MISMAGAAERSFVFPAGLPEAYAFLGDVRRSFAFLPYISITAGYSESEFRLHYRALEAGFYWVDIYCDVQVTREEDSRLLSIRSLPGKTPVESAARWKSMTCQGTYESESSFHQAGSQTRVDFAIRLAADLPLPATLRLVPPALVFGTAHSILQLRIDEIIGKYIDRAIRAYPGG